MWQEALNKLYILLVFPFYKMGNCDWEILIFFPLQNTGNKNIIQSYPRLRKDEFNSHKLANSQVLWTFKNCVLTWHKQLNDSFAYNHSTTSAQPLSQMDFSCLARLHWGEHTTLPLSSTVVLILWIVFFLHYIPFIRKLTS